MKPRQKSLHDIFHVNPATAHSLQVRVGFMDMRMYDGGSLVHFSLKRGKQRWDVGTPKQPHVFVATADGAHPVVILGEVAPSLVGLEQLPSQGLSKLDDRAYPEKGCPHLGRCSPNG